MWQLNNIKISLLFFLVFGCKSDEKYGFLHVAAAGSGSYEIYRISHEAPLQFVSEQAGEFNQDIRLTPGSYLVLADCSSETVIIYPQRQQKLIAHRLQFKPPHQPNPEDSFSIQCSRSEKTKSRQNITNRFDLNVLHGQRDLLVGMVPLRVEFKPTDLSTPTTLTYGLASLQIEAYTEKKEEMSYFVSPANELISLTHSQTFGHNEFLLPGNYVLELNGTTMQVGLTEGERRIVKPAHLSVTTSPEVDILDAVKIKGSPWLAQINGGHWINFNEKYPVLPGKAEVGISGSTQSISIDLVEGSDVELKANSVKIAVTCTDTPSYCESEKNVALYRSEEPYPFVESISDIPIIYIEEPNPILVGIEGSRDITYQLPKNERNKRLSIGFAKIIPEPIQRTSQVTDLVRIEASGHPLSGNSLDISLEKPTVMPLIAGHYTLAHHLSLTQADGERRRTSQNFLIEPGKTFEITIPVFLNEKRFSAWKKKQEETL